MIYLKTEEEIQLIQHSSLLVGKTIAEVARHIKPGITTMELDQIAEEFIRDHGAKPGFKGYRGFPATLCVSVNENVVHGIPDKYELREGDIVSIDCGVLKNGYYGDSAYTFAVGNVKPEVLALMKATKEALYKGIEQAVAGKRIGDIGNAIQQHVNPMGYGIVRELIGHGVGKHLHESPDVPNYGKKGHGVLLSEGMVIAIEPMINLGKRHIVQEDDGWTIRTLDRKPSAHYEHTIAVRKDKADILSSFEEIEKVINN
ncbi:MAG TPA: type I methionyl aminopeptidase [Bacteroidales bacterium]|nr:type I methionyl aminopeptidase [Bacteroidales bacterium]